MKSSYLASSITGVDFHLASRDMLTGLDLPNAALISQITRMMTSVQAQV